MPIHGFSSLFRLSLAAVLLVGCVRTAATPSGEPRLECGLEAVPPLAGGGPVQVRFTLTNRGEAPVWALRWNTPLEESWMGTIFAVSRGGQEIPYQGPMVKRGDPGREEYVEVPAGGAAEAVVDLTEVYEINEPGRYQVEVTEGLQDVATDPTGIPRPRDRHQAVSLSCPALEVDVS